MKAFVTGAAGFIGSTMVDRLLSLGHHVTAYDNFSTGKHEFLHSAKSHPNFTLISNDLLNTDSLQWAMEGTDFVFHFAANADVRHGWTHPTRDLQQNTVATVNVLEAMRRTHTKRLVFASTGSVYGDALVTPDSPTPETAPFPLQTSLYGASKAAAEGFISAYAEAGQIEEAFIFRFVSILGERYTHGHVYDFVQQLSAHPDSLTILGDGSQRKSYLYVGDCINAILHATDHRLASREKHHTAIFNLGTPEFVSVNQSVKILCDELKLTPTLHYTGGDRGWVGDNPFIFLNAGKIGASGWKPKFTIEAGIRATIRWLKENPWVLNPPK